MRCKHNDVHHCQFGGGLWDWHGLLYGRFDEKDSENICLALLPEIDALQSWRSLRLIQYYD